MKRLMVWLGVAALALLVRCGDTRTERSAVIDNEALAKVPKEGVQVRPIVPETVPETYPKTSADKERDPHPASPGFNPLTSPADRAVGPLKVGRGSDPDGRVPDAQQTDVLMTSDPIHFSVADASRGELSIHGENGTRVWSDTRTLEPGKDYLHFELGPGVLAPGRYRAVLAIDGATVTEHTFAVSGGDA